jgi:hypothetical protein
MTAITRPRLNPAGVVALSLVLLAWAGAGLIYIFLNPGVHVPRVSASYRFEHFALFYVVSLIAVVGFPTVSVETVLTIMATFAVVLEFFRLWNPVHRVSGAENLFCDIAGILAVWAPTAADRLRRVFAAQAPPSA